MPHDILDADRTSCSTSLLTRSTCSTASSTERHRWEVGVTSLAGSKCVPKRSKRCRAGIDRPPLQPYGATNPAEFFAVATEAFFDVPIMLEHYEPNLYDVMRDFYKQDPAVRMRR